MPRDEIQEDHLCFFRRIYRLNDQSGTEELPPAVVTEYWATKTLYDRISYPLAPNDLVGIAQRAGSLPGEPEETFLNVIESTPIQYGAPVEAKWRFGRWTPGRYKGLTGDKILVELDDETSEDREFVPKNVRLPNGDPLQV